MANFKGWSLTNQGISLLNTLDGLIFTKAMTSVNAVALSDVPAMTIFPNAQQKSTAMSKTAVGTQTRIAMMFTNEDLQAPYNIYSIGLFVADKNGNDTLFAVGVLDQPSQMPAAATQSSSFGANLLIGISPDKVNLSMNAIGYAMQQDLQKLADNMAGSFLNVTKQLQSMPTKIEMANADNDIKKIVDGLNSKISTAQTNLNNLQKQANDQQQQIKNQVPLIASAQTGNLVSQSVFDDVTNDNLNWTSVGGRVLVGDVSDVPTAAGVHNKALRASGARVTLANDVFPAVPGTIINVSGWVANASTVPVTLGIKLTNNQTNAVTWFNLPSIPSGGGWKQIQGSITIPTGYTVYQPYILSDSIDPTAIGASFWTGITYTIQATANDIAALKQRADNFDIAVNASQTGNLVSHPFFEDMNNSNLNWVSQGGSATVTTSLDIPAAAGVHNKSLRVSGARVVVANDTFQAMPGTVINVSAWVANVSSVPVALGIKLTNTQTQDTSWFNIAAIPSGGGWKQIKGSITIPTGFSVYQPYILSDGSDPTAIGASFWTGITYTIQATTADVANLKVQISNQSATDVANAKSYTDAQIKVVMAQMQTLVDYQASSLIADFLPSSQLKNLDLAGLPPQHVFHTNLLKAGDKAKFVNAPDYKEPTDGTTYSVQSMLLSHAGVLAVQNFKVFTMVNSALELTQEYQRNRVNNVWQDWIKK